MKPMIYGIKESSILAIGKYKGKDYVIVNIRGSYPCAYVESNVDYRDDDNSPARCGFTYYGDLGIWQKYAVEKEYCDMLCKNFIGWDYAHLFDYTPFSFGTDDKKWTTEEIFENVKEVIDWIIEKEVSDDK